MLMKVESSWFHETYDDQYEQTHIINVQNDIIDKLNRKNKFHKVLGRSLPKKLKILKVDK